MTDFEPVEQANKIRARNRIFSGKVDERNLSVSRRKIAAVLILAVAVGIFFGLILGRGIRKIVRLRREQSQIVQSRSESATDASPAAAGDAAPVSADAPGR